MKHQSFLKPWLLLAAALMATMPLLAQMVSNYNEDEVYKVDERFAHKGYRQGELIVKFRETTPIKMRMMNGKFKSTGISKVDKVLTGLGVSEADQLMPRTGKIVNRKKLLSYSGEDVKDRDMSGLYRLRFDSKSVKIEDAIEQLKALDEVEFAEPNYLAFIMSSGSETYTAEPLFSEQWGLTAINMPQLWDIPLLENAKRPVIAILDTGVDIEHPDLAENIWTNANEASGAEDDDDDNNGFTDDLHGWDFINHTAKLADYNGHGTHCAGIAAAVGNNGIGITGANPDAYIMPIIVMQSDGTGDIATIIQGIDYAIDNGADFLSMSIGSYAYSIAQEQALAKAYSKATLVAAAGNDGRCIYMNHHQYGPGPCYPAAFTFVLGVQAAQGKGIANWSNYDCDGPIYSEYGEEQLYNYELLAPGTDICSTYPNGCYASMSGTSMACPLAAGAISRLMQCKNYEYQVINRENLFGDLIHGSGSSLLDIMAAYNYNDTDRVPTLWLVTTEFSDAEEGDGDSRPDAGETIDLYPTVRNDWGNATNIKLHLEMGDELEDSTLIEFINNDVAFGKNLSSYGMAKSDNPVRFKIADSCADNRHIRLKLVATCDESSEPIMNHDFVIVVENGVELKGIIYNDITLYPDVHYIINEPVALQYGVIMTILPGCRLEFGTNGNISAARGQFIANGTPDDPIVFTLNSSAEFEGEKFFGLGSNNEISYCIFENIGALTPSNGSTSCNNCRFSSKLTYWYDENGAHPVFGWNQLGGHYNNYFFSNIKGINSNSFYGSGVDLISNYGNNHLYWPGVGGLKWPAEVNDSVIIDSHEYIGTSSEDYFRSRFDGYGLFTVLYIKHICDRPSKETHGIVWKVVVDGYDAQDEFDLLPPLGVGRHKFEVYFNRDDMDTTAIPTIGMGARPPYTQIGINEDGFWSIKDSVSVYTAFLTITGKLQADGLNRIYVGGAKDYDHFDVPVENSRFNVMVQSVGSLATGFAAEPGLGKVELTWNNENNDIEDAMGYNVYRHGEPYPVEIDNGYDDELTGEWVEIIDTIMVADDTIRINQVTLDINTTSYTDYNVTPGETYYYFYKVISTDLKEYDVSNVVAATPLTSIKGDANGSMHVDVADIVSIVAYLSQQQPQPFIYEAADVNEDGNINILDIVGVINIIAHPEVNAAPSIMSGAVYTIEDGILYVNSPVALGGVQVMVNAPEGIEVKTLEALDAMERMWIQMDENTCLLLAYSMMGKTIPAGKTALLELGNVPVTDIVLSDALGNNIMVEQGDVTTVTEVRAEVKPVATGIYDLMGRKISSDVRQLKHLQPGIYIVNGVKTAKF